MIEWANKSANISFQQKYSTSTILWIIFFCYSILAALVFQKLLLPLIPSLHGTSGLLNADSTFFHSEAVSLARSIEEHGWSSWSIYPGRGATGNVAVLGALYALSGYYNPILIIPINAALHATGGLLIYMLARELSADKTGTYAGIIASILFVVFPSSLNWYGQVHKDGYNILGTLIILYSWVWGVQGSKVKSGMWIILGTAIGTLLVALVRPYNLKLLAIAAGLVLTTLLFYIVFSKKFKVRWRLLGYFLCAMMILMAGHAYTERWDITEHWDTTECWDYTNVNWEWHNSNWMPDKIERHVARAAQIRVIIIDCNERIGAGSLIDRDKKPDDIFSVVGYLPRSLQIALFAPFPSEWFESIKISRMVAVFEMIIWYLVLPGVFLTLYCNRTPAIVISVVIVLFFLTVNGFVIPNVGTLYRVRYCYIFIFMVLGILGWINLFLKNSKPEISH